jgi:tetratricopeptide (TPR) repeat protein
MKEPYTPNKKRTNEKFANSRFPLNASVAEKLLPIACFAVLGFLIYFNTFDAPFVFDDIKTITENSSIRIQEFTVSNIIDAVSGLSKKRIFPELSFALNYYFGHYNPAGYHLVNIIIHIINGILLFFFLKLTFIISKPQGSFRPQSPFSHIYWISFFATLIWLVHPLQTQSVTYTVQRTNSMAATFFLLSLLLYAKGRISQFKALEDSPVGEDKATRKKRLGNNYLWFLGCVLSGILALGSKQNAATLPVMIFFYEWYFFQDLSPKWFKSSHKYIIAVAVLFGIVAFLYLGSNPLEKINKLRDFSHGEFTLAERALTQTRVVVYYLSLIFFPHPSRLNLDYDFPLSHSLFNPTTTLLSLILIIGLIALAVYLAKRERLISFCILWFFGNLVIESSIIPLAIIFEHRTYLPSMMVCLVPVLLGDRFVKINWLKIGLACVVIVVFSFWTFQRNQVWKNEFSLWSDVVKKSPNKARPNLNLGIILSKLGKTDAALTYLKKALLINPNDSVAHNNLGVVLAKKGQLKEAINHFRMALKTNNRYAEAQFNLGAALAQQGKTDEAVDRFYQALRLNPDYADPHNNLGGIFAQQGQNEKAIVHYSAALRLNPQLVQAHNNLGIALMQEGKFADAINHFRKALQIQPDFELAENNLKRALAIQQELEAEISGLQELLQDTPDNVELNFQLGNLYFRKGDRHQAIQQYKKALRLNKKFVPAINNLALVTAANQEYYKALTIFLDVLNYHPDDAETHYNIACMYARLKQVDESIAWLKKAIDKGYTNWESIKKDADLDNIRDAKAYKELIEGR